MNALEPEAIAEQCEKTPRVTPVGFLNKYKFRGAQTRDRGVDTSRRAHGVLTAGDWGKKLPGQAPPTRIQIVGHTRELTRATCSFMR